MILLDSNIIIYAADSTRTDAARFVAENQTAVSAISYVEALGFHDLGVVERQTLEAFSTRSRPSRSIRPFSIAP